jgi:ribosomal protein S18 acetylase RimI-like enzyme
MPRWKLCEWIMQVNIRPIAGTDSSWVREFISRRWGAEFVVVHGVTYYPQRLQGFLAEADGVGPVGLATYTIDSNRCELVTLDSLQEGNGIGTALVRSVAEEASRYGCLHLWCITTNDNLPALRFYQRRGFHIAAVYPSAVDRSRELKPSIPELGLDGIPIRDEIELELQLPWTPSR